MWGIALLALLAVLLVAFVIALHFMLRNVNGSSITGPTGASAESGVLGSTGPAGPSGPSITGLTGPTGPFNAEQYPLVAVVANQADQDAVWTGTISQFVRFGMTGGFTITDNSIQLVTFGAGSPTGDYVQVNDAGWYEVSYHLVFARIRGTSLAVSYIVKNSQNNTITGNTNIVPWTMSNQIVDFFNEEQTCMSVDVTTVMQLQSLDRIGLAITNNLNDQFSAFGLLDVAVPSDQMNNGWLSIVRIAN